MKEPELSIEELWVQLQIRNIRCIKLFRPKVLMAYQEKYGDKDDVVWSQLLVRQHDGYIHQTDQSYEIYTLLIDKVCSFSPLKMIGHEVNPWYYLSLTTNEKIGQGFPHNGGIMSLNLRFKDKLLLQHCFNNPQTLSGDSLLNW